MEEGGAAVMSVHPGTAVKKARKLAVLSASSLEGASNPVIECEWADGFAGRFLGLMGRRQLPEGSGLLLLPCSGIHMWFMRFPIDAVFLAAGENPESWRVTSVRAQLRPWRLLPAGDSRARAVLEIPAGSAARLGIRPGGVLKCIG